MPTRTAQSGSWPMPCELDRDFPLFRRSRLPRASLLGADPVEQRLGLPGISAGPRVPTGAINKLTGCRICGNVSCYNAEPFRLLTLCFSSYTRYRHKLPFLKYFLENISNNMPLRCICCSRMLTVRVRAAMRRHPLRVGTFSRSSVVTYAPFCTGSGRPPTV